MTGYIRPLQRLSRNDEPSFGGKSANLGELLAADIPVPPGFAISIDAYKAFVGAGGLDDAGRAVPIPGEVRAEIAEQYARLGDDPPVAVRSSAIGEDSAQATFAGQQETYLWVRGTDGVCDAVRDCWASLYSPTAVAYRAHLGERAGEAAMGVTVQLMVDAEVSGVMFTCNPVSGDPSMVAVNASWGLGLAVVGGEVTPDDFLVSKVTGEVVREHIHPKEVQYVPDPGGKGAVRVAVDGDRQHEPSLGPADLERLVDLGRRIERHFGCHQDIEWALPRGETERVFVVQTRPVTAMASKADKPKPQSAMSLIMSTFGAAQRKDA